MEKTASVKAAAEEAKIKCTRDDDADYVECKQYSSVILLRM